VLVEDLPKAERSVTTQIELPGCDTPYRHANRLKLLTAIDLLLATLKKTLHRFLCELFVHGNKMSGLLLLCLGCAVNRHKKTANYKSNYGHPEFSHLSFPFSFINEIIIATNNHKT
jgi:hypothetical protein